METISQAAIVLDNAFRKLSSMVDALRGSIPPNPLACRVYCVEPRGAQRSMLDRYTITIDGMQRGPFPHWRRDRTVDMLPWEAFVVTVLDSDGDLVSESEMDFTQFVYRETTKSWTADLSTNSPPSSKSEDPTSIGVLVLLCTANSRS